jgi:hypothetical protein
MYSPAANATEPSDNVSATYDYPPAGDQAQPSTPAGLTSSSSDTLHLIDLNVSFPGFYTRLHSTNSQQVDSDLSDNDSAIGDPSI